MLQQHPLATLITNGPHGLQVSMVPCEIQAPPLHPMLRAHLAKANQAVLENLASQPNCVLLFQGPNAYISPGWYPSKTVDSRTVPTWNYQAVEVRATAQQHTDPVWLRTHLAGLSRSHEDHRNPAWTLDDAPADYLTAMQKAIVGLKFHIQHMQGKFKLSQNRSTQDQAGVFQSLLRDATTAPKKPTQHGHGDCMALAQCMQQLQQTD
jgi:transcriptional regulator